MKSKTVLCGCCYCGSQQRIEEPPGLHVCTDCGHTFRTFRAYGFVACIELTEQAKKFFSKPKGTA